MSEESEPRGLRHRRPSDVPALVDALLDQRPYTGYPASLPPQGPEGLIVRDLEVGAWVWAGADDEPLGHVSVTRVGEAYSASEETEQWCAALGCGPESLGAVSALFVARSAWRRGIASALMEQATAACRKAGLHPVLDVVPSQPGTVELYEKLGWERVGTVRPFWLTDDLPDAVTMVLR